MSTSVRVIQGNNTSEDERSGTLQFHGAKDVVLGSVELSGVGIFSLGLSRMDAADARPDDLEVRMYVEAMRFLPRVAH